MAGMDYYDCDNCGKGKIFYDANIDWESFGERIGQIRAICTECFEKGFRLNIIKSSKDTSINWGVHRWTSENE